MSDADGAATLAAFTVEATAAAARHFPAPASRGWSCGGGRRNPALMRALAARLEARVEPIEAIGFDGDVVEAQCFAYLALRSRRGLPISLPTTTGAPRPMTGGAFWPAKSGDESSSGGTTSGLVDRPDGGTGGGEVEEDKAVENRQLAMIVDGEKARREMGHEIGHGHEARQNEGAGRVRKPTTIRAPPISSTTPVKSSRPCGTLLDAGNDGKVQQFAGSVLEEQEPGHDAQDRLEIRASRPREKW